ncbi:MAG: AAA family ATPase [Verrucomicrobiales bacterium]|nr:AAA family ATPase [Verrucomicrobiales bacterium]
MITKIEAANYRCLRGVSQTLDRFHVVAGPNGSGKSTFFEVPKVLAAFGRDGLPALWEAGNATHLEELLFLGRGDHFELAIEMEVPTALREQRASNGKAPRVVRYEIRAGRQEEDAEDAAPRILAENLWLLPASAPAPRAEVVQMDLEFPSEVREDFTVVHDSGPKRAGWLTVARKTRTGSCYYKAETTKWNFPLRNAPHESALRGLPSDERFPLSNWFRQQLFEGVHHLALNSEVMRRPSPPLKQRSFLADGSNLPQVVTGLPGGPAGLQAWTEHLRTVLPVTGLTVLTKEEDKSRYLVAHFEGGAKVPSWHLSDGTLRLLALTLLAYLPNNTSTYFVEEPENGIHPQAVEAVFQSLSSVYEGQVLVATHSPVLVGLIEPRQLLCFSRTTEGATDILTGDQHPKLAEWRNDLPLARMYAAGILS